MTNTSRTRNELAYWQKLGLQFNVESGMPIDVLVEQFFLTSVDKEIESKQYIGMKHQKP